MDGSHSNTNETSEETESRELLNAVDIAIHAMKTTLGKKGCEKGSLTDLIRLLQLRRELAAERPRHVTVRWIDE